MIDSIGITTSAEFLYRFFFDSMINSDKEEISKNSCTFSLSKEKSREELLAILHKLFSRFKYNKLGSNAALDVPDAVVNYYYFNQDKTKAIYIVGHWGTEVTVIGIALEEKLKKELKLLALKYKQVYKYQAKIHVITICDGGFESTTLPVDFSPLELGNYDHNQIKAYRHICEDLVSSNPCGRLVILDGPPGTGKSYFVRGIIASVEAFFMLISADVVSGLSGPSLLTFLLNIKKHIDIPLVLIIEDADMCLLPRDGMNMSSISSLLNFGDGILGDALDVRLICTTNAKSMEIDEALVRTGRLCTSLSIGLCDPERASIIYHRLTGEYKEFDDYVRLSDVYETAKDKTGHKNVKKVSKCGFI